MQQSMDKICYKCRPYGLGMELLSAVPGHFNKSTLFIVRLDFFIKSKSTYKIYFMSNFENI